MSLNDEQIEGARYFDEKYDILFMRPLVADAKVDGANASEPRVCRFCGKTEPEVTFAKEAHAIPEFLFNKSLISMNECDTCNKYIADHAENDLANWLGPLRTAMQMEGKKGVPTYDAKDVRIETTSTCLAVNIKAPIDDPGLKEGESVDFTLPVETPTPSLTPINAAKALVKIACSIPPAGELPQLQQAIDWIMGRTPATFKRFPIVFSFTPGANPYRVGMAILCRRKVEEDIPYFWCVLATHNVNFQFFVPLCPKDKIQNKQTSFTSIRLFPTPFTELPHGPTKWSILNWASEVKAPQKPVITFHADKVTKTVPPSLPEAA